MGYIGCVYPLALGLNGTRFYCCNYGRFDWKRIIPKFFELFIGSDFWGLFIILMEVLF